MVRANKAADLHDAANAIERLKVEAETYRQMHEIATELGYPSILEALEDVERLKEENERKPDWKLVHAVRSGALNALRHAGVSEDLFATVAAATYAPIRSALSTREK